MDNILPVLMLVGASFGMVTITYTLFWFWVNRSRLTFWKP
jgi:hypothetical protein